MQDEFIEAIRKNSALFGVELSDQAVTNLGRFFDLIQEHNPILHLVGPSSAEEFATRHVLESLTLLEHLPFNAKLADVGTGGGLPSIPCLLARDDLAAILIESKAKKTRFLDDAVEKLGIKERVTIVTKQFEEADLVDATVVSCRALEKFSEKLPKMLRWSKARKKLFFGGDNLGEILTKNKVEFTQKLMPLSERRYLFIIER